MDQTDLFKKLLTREAEKVLEDLYDWYREAFFRWARSRFECSHAALQDAWQDAVIVFYDQVKSGRLTSLQCSVKTYLFAVGFRILSASGRKQKNWIKLDEVDTLLEAQVMTFEWDDPWLEERAMLLTALQELSPQCQQLLTQRYYAEKTLPELQTEFGYNSLDSVNVSLSRCLKRLKEMIAGSKPKRDE
jgi:RNA polymerase sigma factor (sigma-70 family)